MANSVNLGTPLGPLVGSTADMLYDVVYDPHTGQYVKCAKQLQAQQAYKNSIFTNKVVNTTCKGFLEKYSKEREAAARDIFLNKLALDDTVWKLAQFQYNQTRIAGPKKWAININSTYVATLEYAGHVLHRVDESSFENGDPMTMAIYHVVQNALDKDIDQMKSLGEVSDIVTEETLVVDGYPKISTYVGSVSYGQ